MFLTKKLRFLPITFFALLLCFFHSYVFANEKTVTIVNPVRSRQLWKDQSLKPLNDQYQIINDLGLSATWLLQDDTLSDWELIEEIKTFNPNQEFGLFLEISPNLAQNSRVYYPSQIEWYNPKAVFLSGYEVKDRRKMIDNTISNFKNTFGYLPKSVGAWWIDSWSQQYLEQKYHITNFMIVADQKTTDQYGVWGQWWGYPYHPSKNNILVPGNSPSVIIQWAQRDLSQAYYGQGPETSNYSLQANDYSSQGLDFSYFSGLANQYLAVNPLGQITIGLETGMESIGNESEYEKQLNWISQNQINSLKMSEFGDKYRQIYQDKNPSEIILGDWVLTSISRENSTLNEKITYNSNLSFSDKFIADKSSFLNRVLSTLDSRKELFYWPLFLLLIPALIYYSKSVVPILFILILYFPIFRSYYSSGWKIFYGPVLNNLSLWQILILIISTILVTKISRKLKIHWSSWFSVFFINLIVFTARYSLINGQQYFGFLLDNFRFIGISIGNNCHFLFQDLSGLIASSMLRFDHNWIWQNWWSWIIIYPLTEILLVFLINKFIPKKIRYFLSLTLIIFLYFLIQTAPLVVN